MARGKKGKGGSHPMGGPVNTAHLRIAYDGPALSSGDMDVRDLAPSLISLGEVFQEANKVLYGDERAVRVLVKTGFQPGSFGVELEVVQGWVTSMFALLSGSTASGAANLIEILGFGKTIATSSVLWGIKKLKGRKPKTIISVDAGDDVTLELDEENFSIKKSVFNVMNDVKVRSAIFETLRPLSVDGIDRFEVIEREHGHEKKIVIAKTEDLPLLAPPLPTIDHVDQELASSSRSMALTVIAPNFREGNKWKFYDGENTILAEMGDPLFLRKLDERTETFAKDDVQICDVTTRQIIGPSGLRLDSVITRVAEHKRLPRQVLMDLFDVMKKKDE